MAGTGQQEAPEEPEVRAAEKEATEELGAGGAQQEALKGSSSDEDEDRGG
jgi:hypothetical protein